VEVDRKMTDDPSTDELAGFDDFLRQQAGSVAPPVIRTAPLSALSSVPPSQRIVITRLYLPLGDVFRLVVQMTAASLVISLGLGLVAVLLMLVFGVGWLFW
jgi:hypothetical protein